MPTWYEYLQRAAAGDEEAAAVVSQLRGPPRPRRPIPSCVEEIGGYAKFKEIAQYLGVKIAARGSRVQGRWLDTSDYDISILKRSGVTRGHVQKAAERLGVKIDAVFVRDFSQQKFIVSPWPINWLTFRFRTLKDWFYWTTILALVLAPINAASYLTEANPWGWVLVLTHTMLCIYLLAVEVVTLSR